MSTYFFYFLIFPCQVILNGGTQSQSEKIYLCPSQPGNKILWKCALLTNFKTKMYLRRKKGEPTISGRPFTFVWGPGILGYVPQFIGPYRTVQHHTGQCSTVQHRTGPYSIVQDSAAPYSTIQDRTVPYRTVQDSTAPYRTVQHRTASYRIVYRTIQVEWRIRDVTSRYSKNAMHAFKNDTHVYYHK